VAVVVADASDVEAPLRRLGWARLERIDEDGDVGERRG
jgi:hypothetical protein